MANIYEIGNKVQAVDQIGRWENAIVKAVDGHSVTVKFPGWPGFDRQAQSIEIRPRVLPKEESDRGRKFIENFLV